MPTTLANAVLGTVPDRSLPVVGPERWAALVPMYEEEEGAARALASLLAQTVPLDQLVVSINGGRDRTPEVVAATLRDHGYVDAQRRTCPAVGAPCTRWRRTHGGPDVVVVEHSVPTAKAESLNLAVAGGLVDAGRILVVDGDTVLDPGFVAAAQGACYRLRRERRGGARRWILEDVALVSGAVTSARPEGLGRTARFISAARDAEYAFAVAVRRGQTARLGGATFGASRLFTVVGCGFVARRDAFPIPDDTLTEDHDFTVQELARPVSERTVEVGDLHRQGFRVVVDGVPRPLAEVVPEEELTLRHAAEARFEPAATMTTEDPRHLGGYLHQVERWVGGALDVVGKRAGTGVHWRALPPNARFALLAAQLENLAGLLLLLALPAALGLTLPWAGGGGVTRKALAYLGADLVVSGGLVFLGAWLHARAQGRRWWSAAGSAMARAGRGLLPLLLLRPVNALAYASALARALQRLAGRWVRRERATSTVWDRPAAVPRRPHGRTVAVAFGMASLAAAGFVAAAWPGWRADPASREAWRAIRQVEIVALEEVALLPLTGTTPKAPSRGPSGGVDTVATGYCPPSLVARAAEPRRLSSEVPYAPLGSWALMTLARLAPLAHALEEAATAYDVPAVLLLQVLLNESYLDPLAEGPTDDLGLAQMTPDALALLRAISTEPSSPYANPALFARPYNVFDPEFSLCAGAAKLAWARGATGGGDDQVAYARYVNPIDGVVDAAVSARHRPLVDAFVRVGGMANVLAATFEAYRRDPASVAPREAALLQVADAVARGEVDVEAAYRAVQEAAIDHAIDDVAFFDRVLVELYGERRAVSLVDGAWARARAP